MLPWQHVLQLLTFPHTERVFKHFYIFIVITVLVSEAGIFWKLVIGRASGSQLGELTNLLGEVYLGFSLLTEIQFIFWVQKLKDQICSTMHYLDNGYFKHKYFYLCVRYTFLWVKHFYMDICCVFVWMCAHTCIVYDCLCVHRRQLFFSSSFKYALLFL